MGCSLLPLATASFSNLWSLTPALRSLMEFLDFSCNALMSPLRFLEICLRTFSSVLGILKVYSSS